MVATRNRRTGALSILIVTMLLGACATGPARRSYPVRPFNASMLNQINTGIPADSVITLFGQPDTIYDMTFGAKTDRKWDGVAYRYYAAKDPLYQYVDEWKKNTFYFYRSPQGLVLNHWVIEHELRAEAR